MTPAPSSLPSVLADRVPEPERQRLDQAPRAERLELLARSLNVTVDSILAELAAATHLPLATNLHAAEDDIPLLPPRLAHEYQVLPLACGAAQSGAIRV